MTANGIPVKISARTLMSAAPQSGKNLNNYKLIFRGGVKTIID